MPASTIDTGQPKLKRVLGLWDLVFYGIILIQPIASVGLFGIASKESGGHMVTTLLIAMIAMMLTAISYGRMASLYPSAGSAYTYVGKGLNGHLGFLAGWSMFLDYLVIPIINTVYASLTLERLIPSIPFTVWIFLFVFVITFFNLRGMKTTAKSNKILLFIMCVVIGIFIVQAIRYIVGNEGISGLFSLKPIYNPETFDLSNVMVATSFAVLTYIGFDGVTTLAEDVKNPKRNMLLAPVIVCLFTGLFSGLQIYLAQKVWPDYNTFPNIETAFYDVCARVGGMFLFNAIAAILFVACLGSGMAGQVGAARLLFGMGRDGVIPKKIFGYLNPKTNTPTYNIIIMGILTIAGSLSLDYKNAAELLNFGAFLAFMGVNLACFRQFYILKPEGHSRNFFYNGLLPIIGFAVCLVIWVSLPTPAKIMGGLWLLAGSIYLLIKSKGFKRKPDTIKFD